jgi:hypothetical protein
MIAPILAESIEGPLKLLFEVSILAVCLALVGLWPAFRGHWSALLLAAPAILLGLTRCYEMATAENRAYLDKGLWGWALVPLSVGVASAVLWLYRVPPPKERA